MSVPANLAPARGARTPEPEAEAIDAASAAESASLMTRLGRLWERGRLPIVNAGFDLLFAAGLGMDCRHVNDGPGRVALRWESAAPAIPA